jgi:hypothetical protein
VDYADEAASALGLGPDEVDRLASIGLRPSVILGWQRMPPDARALVVRALSDPTPANLTALAGHPDGPELGAWLVGLIEGIRDRAR